MVALNNGLMKESEGSLKEAQLRTFLLHPLLQKVAYCSSTLTMTDREELEGNGSDICMYVLDFDVDTN